MLKYFQSICKQTGRILSNFNQREIFLGSVYQANTYQGKPKAMGEMLALDKFSLMGENFRSMSALY